MSTVLLNDGLVGAVLWRHIKPFKEKLNIVENPSVGSLRASAEACELVDFAIKTMLQVSLDRHCQRVRVYCTVGGQRTLILGVADDGGWHDVRSQFLLTEIGIWIYQRYGTKGQLVLGNLHGRQDEVAVEIRFPLLPA